MTFCDSEREPLLLFPMAPMFAASPSKPLVFLCRGSVVDLTGSFDKSVPNEDWVSSALAATGKQSMKFG